MIQGQKGFVAVAAGLLLAFSILLGGSSKANALPLAILETGGLIVLALAALKLAETGDWRRHKTALALVAAIAAIPLIQIIPLPPLLWARLPGREEMVVALSMLDQAPGWGTLSLTPEATWGSALALIVPIALFLATLTLDGAQRFAMVCIILGGAAVSILLGAVQLVSGTEAFYPHESTAAGMVVGFFANRNHLATFLLMTLPFAAALAVPSRRWPIPEQPLRWLCALFAVLAVVAMGVIRSRAGIVLLGPALIGGLLVVLRSVEAGRSIRAVRVWVAGSVIACAAVLAFGLSPITERFEAADGGAGRFNRWPAVLELAGNYQPTGSGMSSFYEVYRSVEPVRELDPTYFNRAHNDYLELWLEAGWMAAIVLVLVLIWFGRNAWATWAADPMRRPAVLARAAGVSVVLLALHSAVDFPLRTETIMALLAVCLGFVATAGADRRPPPSLPVPVTE